MEAKLKPEPIMNKWEAILIINPDLPCTKIRMIKNKYINFVENFSSYKAYVEDLGIKSLAYDLKKHKTRRLYDITIYGHI